MLVNGLANSLDPESEMSRQWQVVRRLFVAN
jgi:hypothetical protein